MMPDVYCTDCGWEGYTTELDGVKCPVCGSRMGIEDCRPLNESLADLVGNGNFGWNKV